MSENYESLSLFKCENEYTLENNWDNEDELNSINSILNAFSPPLQSKSDQSDDIESFMRQSRLKDSSFVLISNKFIELNNEIQIDNDCSNSINSLWRCETVKQLWLNHESWVQDCKTSDLKRKSKIQDIDEQNNLSSEELSKPTQIDLIECMHDESKVKFCLNRRDVVIKRYTLNTFSLCYHSICFLFTKLYYSILRSMRKYYSDLMQDNTNYRRNMRNIKLKHKMLISCSEQVCKSLLKSETSHWTPFFLAAIAFPNDLKKILMKSLKTKRFSQSTISEALKNLEIIEGVMNKFSFKSLNEFIHINEISVLLLNYLSKVQNIEYKKHYEMLIEMATHSLSISWSNNSKRLLNFQFYLSLIN